MFDWMQNKQAPLGSQTIDSSNYGYEANGLYLAFEEAYSDLADINIMFAHASAAGTNLYAQKWHEGGEKDAQAAVEAYQHEPAFEGFLGNVKDRLVKLLKALKDKIKAFFHSAVQYFDAFFKDGAAFAEKYEDELKDKKLDGFKYPLYDWKLDKGIADDWKNLTKYALNAAKGQKVAIESMQLSDDDWIGAVSALLEVTYWKELSTGMAYKNIGKKRARSGGYQRITEAEYNKIRGIGGGESSNDSSTSNNSSDDDDDDDDGDDGSADMYVDKSVGKVEAITSTQRKFIIGYVIKQLGGSKPAIDSFKKEMRKKFQGDKNDPREVVPNIDKIISALKDTDAVDNIKDAGDAILEGIDEEIDKANDADKSGDKAIISRNRIAIFTTCKDVFMAYFDVYKDCLKARESQYKGCLSKALHYTAKDD